MQDRRTLLCTRNSANTRTARIPLRVAHRSHGSGVTPPQGVRGHCQPQGFPTPRTSETPVGHTTKQYPLHASHFEEASVQGNTAVVNNIYIPQLQMSETDFDDRAIPCINDQLTNARLSSLVPLTTTHSLGSSFYNLALVFFMHI